jgi:hypothetical protein
MSFSFGETLSFSLLPVSPITAIPGFLHRGCYVAPPPHRLFQLCILPLPPGKGEILPLCIWPPVLSRGNAIGSLVEIEYEVSSHTACCTYTWQLSRITLLRKGQLQGRTGRSQRGFVSLCICWVLVLPDACSCYLSVVLCVRIHLTLRLVQKSQQLPSYVNAHATQPNSPYKTTQAMLPCCEEAKATWRVPQSNDLVLQSF